MYNKWELMMNSWGISPLCGSTTHQHMVEALEATTHDDFDTKAGVVKELWDLMHR